MHIWIWITNLFQNLKEMEVEMKRLEELYNGILGLQTLAEKMNDCNHELQWAYVNEIEKVQLQVAENVGI